MSLRLSDAFLPSPERLIEMSDREKLTLVTLMCAFGSAAALTLSNLGDYHGAERDLSALSPEQATGQADDFIQHYQDNLGVVGKVMNYGLYRSALNHDSEE